MPKCGCNGESCRCVLKAGAGVTVTGSGTARDPWQVSAEGGAGGGAGWSPGDLKDTAGFSTPAGWLECNGQAVSRETYAALYAAIGTTWGIGNGTSTFNLPDMGGRVRLGVNGTYPMGNGGGAATVALGVANLPVHDHTIAHTHTINHDHGSFLTAATEGKHDHAGNLRIATDAIGKDEAGNNVNSAARGPGPGNDTTAPLSWTATGGEHRHTINVPAFVGSSGASSAARSGATGSGSAFSILPPFRAVRVLIKT